MFLIFINYMQYNKHDNILLINNKNLKINN